MRPATLPTDRGLSRLLPVAVVIAVCAAGVPSRADESVTARTFQEAASGRGSLRYVDGVPVLTLVGTPEEIGRQQAALAIAPIKPLLSIPRTMLEGSAPAGWPILAGFARGMLTHGPDRYRAEIDAAAEAARLTPDEKDAFVAANVMIELRRNGGCSSLIVEPDRSATGGMLFGRNLDLPSFGALDKLGLVTVVRPDGRKAFVAVGFPALVGVISGMNEDGLALANLDVTSSKDGSPMFDPLGVPLALTYRQILEECSTVAEAEKLLRARRHTTWMNLACCDEKSAVVFEITPKGVVVRKPEEGVLACTNHFRSNELCTSKSCERFDALCEVAAAQRLVGLPELRKALDEAHQADLTIQSMIFEPAARAVHVGFGAPPVTARPFTRLDAAALLANPRLAAE